MTDLCNYIYFSIKNKFDWNSKTTVSTPSTSDNTVGLSSLEHNSTDKWEVAADDVYPHLNKFFVDWKNKQYFLWQSSEAENYNQFI